MIVIVNGQKDMDADAIAIMRSESRRHFSQTIGNCA